MVAKVPRSPGKRINGLGEREIRKIEVGGRGTEDRGRKIEDRRQKTEGREMQSIMDEREEISMHNHRHAWCSIPFVAGHDAHRVTEALRVRPQMD